MDSEFIKRICDEVNERLRSSYFFGTKAALTLPEFYQIIADNCDRSGDEKGAAFYRKKANAIPNQVGWIVDLEEDPNFKIDLNANFDQFNKET